MAQPYVGEIRMFAGNFAPAGWLFCEGQLLPISENETLFNLIGTTYGGDGQQTFALPDLRGRVPVHQGERHHARRGGRHRDGDAHRRAVAKARAHLRRLDEQRDDREPERATSSRRPRATRPTRPSTRRRRSTRRR